MSLEDFEKDYGLDVEENYKRFFIDEDKEFDFEWWKVFCFFFYRKEMEVFKFFLEFF